METMRPFVRFVGLKNKARVYPGSILVCLSTPGRANYSYPAYFANGESVLNPWTSLFLKLRAKKSRNECIVAKALWTELRSE